MSAPIPFPGTSIMRQPVYQPAQLSVLIGHAPSTPQRLHPVCMRASTCGVVSSRLFLGGSRCFLDGSRCFLGGCGQKSPCSCTVACIVCSQAAIGNYAVPILEERTVWGTNDVSRIAYMDSTDVAKLTLAALRWVSQPPLGAVGREW